MVKKMIRVKEHNIINFFTWIDKSQNSDLNIIIDSYLEHNSRKWDLNLFLKLYEEYVYNLFHNMEEVDYVKTFKDFYSNKENLQYVSVEVIYKTIRLKPFLRNFKKYLCEEKMYLKINKEITEMAYQVYRRENGFVEWFEYVSINFGEKIANELNLYIKNSLNFEYMDFYDLDKVVYEVKKTRKVTEMNEFYSSIRRNALMESAKRYKRKKTIITVKHCILQVGSVKYMDFLIYLAEKNMRIEKNIPKYMWKKYIEEYCSANKIENSKSLQKEILKLTSNKKKLEEVLEKLIMRMKKEEKNIFNINRYYKCKYHAVLLFEQFNKFNKFLDDFFNDIHEFTGDVLDIYYTKEDLKRNISGYKRINEYCSLQVKKEEIPCLIIWRNENFKKEVIQLKELEHKEVFDVIKAIVIGLEISNFEEAIKSGKEEVKKIKNSKKNNYYHFEHCQIGGVGDVVKNFNMSFK